MWITNSHIAKAIVWMAAVMLPANMLLADVCGCSDQNTGNISVKAAMTHSALPGCCIGKVCKCGHKAQKIRKATCCENKTAQSVSSRSALASPCTCAGNQTPVTQTTLPDSSAAKQSTNHATACVGLTSVSALPSACLHFVVQFPSLPATPLERLSNLCRLII
jgi:hypothetical protein